MKISNPKFLIVLFFTTIFYSLSSYGATRTFSGTGNFSSSIRWGGTRPVAGDNIVINGTCTFDNSATSSNYGTLTMNNNSSLSWPAGGTNTLKVTNVLLGSGSASINMTNGGTLTFSGSWPASGITFTAGSGTLNPTGTITLPSVLNAFNNLTIGGTVTLSNAITCGSSLTISSAATLNTSASNYSVTVSGPLSIASSAVFTANSSNINVSGNWSCSGTMTAGGHTVLLNGSSTQTLSGSSLSFNHLTIGGTANTVTLGAAAVCSGDFLVSANSTFNTSATNFALTVKGNLTINSGSPAGVFTANASTISVGGNWTKSGTFTAGTSTVLLNGLAAQSIAGSTNTAFNNLTISNTTAPIGVTRNCSSTGTLTVNAGAVLSPSAANTIGGAGTLTGFGKLLVSLSTGTNDFSGQYTITNKTLTNLTVEFVGISVQGSGTPTFGNLTLNNSAGLNLSANTTVNGILNLALGNINTSSFRLTLGASGIVNRTSGFVIGKLEKNISSGSNIVTTFELGTGSDYLPMTLTFPSVSNAGKILVSTVATDHPNIGTSNLDATKTINRYWSVVNTGTIFSTCDASFNFVSNDLDAGLNTSYLEFRNYDGGSWSAPLNGTIGGSSAQLSGISALGDYQVGEFYPAPVLSSINPSVLGAGSHTNVTLSGSNFINGVSTVNFGSGITVNSTQILDATTILADISIACDDSLGVRNVSVSNSAPGGGVSSTQALTVNRFVKPVLNPTGNISLCQGDSTLLSTSNYSTYLWSNAATTSTISIKSAGSYTLNVTDSNGCAGSTAMNLSLRPLIGKIGALNGPAISCMGNVATYFVSPVSNATNYVWTVPNGAVINSGQGTMKITVTFGSMGGNVCVTASNSCGNSLSSCKTVFIGNPIAAGTIKGSTNVCVSGLTGLSYSVSAVNGATSYQWTVPQNAVIVSGQGTKAIVVDFTNNLGGNICVSSVNSCGQSSPSCLLVSGTNPGLAKSISGSSNVCFADTNLVPYSIVAVASASNYIWTAPANATIMSGQGTAKVSVKYSKAFSSGQLCVQASNYCQTTALSCKEITNKPSMPSAISGPQNLCVVAPGDQTYSVSAVAGADSYAWTVPQDANITSGQGTASITVGFAQGFVSGSICVSANNVCGSGVSKCITVSSGLVTPGAVSGSSVVCAGQTGVSYTVTPVSGAVSYQWVLPSGASISLGSGTNTVKVDFGSVTGDICVSATNSCGTSLQSCKNVIVNVIPAVPASISGITNVCSSPALNFDYTIMPVSGATTYNWTVPSIANVISGQGTTALKVALNGSVGNLCVNASNSCGISAPKCILLTNIAPLAPSSIVGSSNVCYAGVANVSYSVGVLSGAGSYTWSLPSGASISSGQGTNLLSVSYSDQFVSGLICVRGQNYCGLSSPQTCKLITDAPIIYNKVVGLASVSAGSSGIVYSISAPAGATSYTWIEPVGATITSGQGTNSITLSFDAGFAGGNLCITASNTCGTSSAQCLSIKVQ